MTHKNLITPFDVGKWNDPTSYNLNFSEPVIILPDYGEFGWFIMRYVRWANLIEAPQKIICCRKGEELYFPSTADFFYDWKNPILDKHRCGWRDADNEDKLRLIEVFSKEYPDHKIIDPVKLFNHTIIDFGGERGYDFAHPRDSSSALKVKPLHSQIGLKFDVAFGPRKRERSGGKNYPYWNKIGKMLKAEGKSYAVIGDKETSYHIEGASAYAWDFPSLGEACIDILQSSKVFVGTNTGTAHLAALAKVDMILICRDTPNIEASIKTINTKKSKFLDLSYAEPSPSIIFDNIVKFL